MTLRVGFQAQPRDGHRTSSPLVEQFRLFRTGSISRGAAFISSASPRMLIALGNLRRLPNLKRDNEAEHCSPKIHWSASG